MTYTDATIHFPPDRLAPEFVAEYLTRYTDRATGWAAVHWDDSEKTRRRKASLFDGSIQPTPVRSGPEPELGEEDTRPIVALIIRAGWPEQFLTDIAAGTDPLLEGIVVQPE